MDVLQKAALFRARDALGLVLDNPGTTNTRAKAFVEMARLAAIHPKMENFLSAAKHHQNDLVQKAAAMALDVDSLWQGPEAQSLAEAFLESVAERSIIDLLKRYAKVLPAPRQHAMLASDGVGDMVAEGLPKPIRSLALSLAEIEPLKAVAMVAASKELLTATGEAGLRLFERELRESLVRAMNLSLLGQFLDSNSATPINSTAFNDYLAALREGLSYASPSEGFIVAVSHEAAAYFSTCAENRGAGPRGGEFSMGIHLVAVDDLPAGQMVVIPASRVVLFDGGLTLKANEHATIDLRETFHSPAAPTSLFQTNTAAMLAERSWWIGGDAQGVIVNVEKA